MTKEQYKYFVRSQKHANARPTRLIHLLINYRSKNLCRYPKGFFGVMKRIKAGQLTTIAGISIFETKEGKIYRQPSFNHRIYDTIKEVHRVIEYDDLPF